MLKAIAALLAWAPMAFDWLLAPAAAILLVLALIKPARPVSAIGFAAVAAASGIILSIVAAAVIYLCFGYIRSLLNILVNFGPSVAGHYLRIVFRQRGDQFFQLAPMILTTVGSGFAAIMLRAGDARSVRDGSG
ncbi:MAG TPA: hypothetical protein VIM02_03425 [Rhizomicrobium sp.]|jgi:hypothetical protein